MDGDKDFVSRKEFNIERDRINDKMEAVNSRITIVETLCASLNDLPKTIASLDKNMALMQMNLKNLNDEFKNLVEDREQEKAKNAANEQKQNDKISKIDGKSKIDFLVWIRDNWVSVLTFFGMIFLFLKDFLA